MKATVKNDSPNGWVVQKFGGTSIGKFPDKVRPQIDPSLAAMGQLTVVEIR